MSCTNCVVATAGAYRVIPAGGRGGLRRIARSLWGAFVLILVIVSQSAIAQDTSQRKPNIILIMADDLGYEALACNGNDLNKTPNLDLLAGQGMRFTHAYSTPLCTPTRVQLMTGKYNFRNYIGFGLLKPGEKTFGDLLRAEGYVTGIAGKWQLFGYEKQWQLAGGKKGSRPEDAGFDEYCLWQIDQLGSRFKDPLISTSKGTTKHTGQYGPDVMADFALNFIESNSDTPFFLYYPMVLTHDPFQPTPDNPGFEDFDATTGLNDPKYFGEMVGYMDKIVGRIVAKLREVGVSENTLIIFIGDNGTHKRVVSSFNGEEIRGDKGQPTTYGTHVPMIAYWEGTIKPGQVNDNLIDFTDFLPTFMDVAGSKVPGDFHTDGLSFLSQLVNKKGNVRDWVYCSYDPNWGGREAATWAHDRRWKLYGDDRFYDIQNDPLELSPIDDETMTSRARKARKALKKAISEYTR